MLLYICECYDYSYIYNCQNIVITTALNMEYVFVCLGLMKCGNNLEVV